MIELSIADIAKTLGGRLVGGDAPVSGAVHTDSRAVVPGDIFFALPGETTDGHLFAPAAVGNGAALLVVERELETSVPQIVVADGVVALSDLAREVVARVRAGGALRVVAVTGSNGKTTTKNMLSAILGAEGATVAPVGSFNNEVGAPISMLGIDHGTRYLVVEMGADGVGDIAKLVSVAKPDVGIVLTVGLAHVGKFGSADAIELGSFKQPGGKVIIAFAAEGDFDLRNFRSNMFEMEWPPKSGKLAEFPEADRAAWFAPAEALRKVTKGQVAVVQALMKKLGVAGS